MSFPGANSLLNYGGALNNYSAVVDPTTDLDAAAGNTAFADVAGMTHAAPLAWVQLIPNGTNVPAIGLHDARWGNALIVAPQPLRDSGGKYRLEWPTTVSNEIPQGSPGFLGPQPLNLTRGHGQAATSGFFHVQVQITAPNEATIWIRTLTAGAMVLTDATGIIFDIWVY